MAHTHCSSRTGVVLSAHLKRSTGHGLANLSDNGTVLMQAIAETPGFRAPWFGRSSRGRAHSFPGRRNTTSRGRGRGRGHRHEQHCSDHQYMNGPGLSVEDIVGSCQSLSHNSPIPDGIYQALFHFDSRAASLLLKDLSKAGLGYRAMEMFDWLRALDVSHPLRHLCDVYTYTAMISLCIYNQVDTFAAFPPCAILALKIPCACMSATNDTGASTAARCIPACGSFQNTCWHSCMGMG